MAKITFQNKRPALDPANPNSPEEVFSSGDVNEIKDSVNTLHDSVNTGLSTKVDKVSGKVLSSNDFTTVEKDKLFSIFSGATVNDSDANLKNRANHTGTQSISTITGLQSSLDSKVTSIDIDNAIVNKVDKDGSKVLSDVNFSTAKDTKLNSIASGATVNDTDANLKNRSNHTGVQPISTISDLQSNLDSKVAKDGTKVLSDVNFSTAKDAKLSGVASGATANDTDVNLKNRANHTGTQAISTVTGLQTELDSKITPLNVDVKINTYDTQIQGGASNDNNTLKKLSDKISALQALFNGDDINLDSIKEISDAIKNDQSLLQALNLNKINVSDIYNALDQTISGKVLDARQGKVLKNLIDSLTTIVNGKEDIISSGTTSQYFRGDKTFVDLNKTVVGLSNVDNTSDLNKPVSTATQTALDNKVTKDGTKVLSDVNFTLAKDTKLSGIASGATANDTDTNLKNRANHTGTQPISSVSGLQSSLDDKQEILVSGVNIKSINGIPLIGSGNLTISGGTGGATTIDGSQVTSGTIDDARLSNNVVLTSGLTISLNLKENVLPSGTTTQYLRGDKTFVNIDKSTVGLTNVDNTSDVNKPVSTAQQAVLDTKVPTTRTVAGKSLVSNITLVKDDVGLSNVDNTSDANKPVSTSQQTALDTKVPTTRTIAGKSLSSDVTLVKGDVGLGNVDNTSDLNKPVSTAVQTLLDAKAIPADIDTKISTYNTQIQGGASSGDNTLKKLADKIVALQALFNGDDINLDSIKELADAIKNDKSLLEALSLNKINISDIYNSLDQTIAGKVLDARQGKVLKDNLDSLVTIVNQKENIILSGTTGQYLRGDKTFVDLNKSAVGLSNVDNTSDANKPLSTATSNAIASKVDKDGTKVLSDVNFSTAKDTKLSGVASGATANDTDANLKNRANHTGEQTISTITGLQTSLDSKVAKDGTKVLSDVNFSTAKDTKLSGVASGATANDTDANLKNRENHTGTQATSTITGLDTALSGKQDTLVSGTNIKTINGVPILGNGNVVISGSTASATETLTNKTISGSNNVITNIPSTAISTSDVQVIDLSQFVTIAQVQQMIADAIANGGGTPTPIVVPSIISDTNTAAWFKAQDESTITKDGNNVSEWRDSLGRSASLAIPSAGHEPIWSTAGIAFTTGISKLSALMPIPQPITIYMVVKQFGNFTDGNRLFYGQDNVTSYGVANGSEPLVYLQAPNEFATRINPYGEFNVVKFVLNGANSKILVNNFTEQAGNAGTTAMADFILGTLYDGFAANTQYKEIIIRKVADNSTDETTIFNYLKTKYSL